jgi:hypothetical protein
MEAIFAIGKHALLILHGICYYLLIKLYHVQQNTNYSSNIFSVALQSLKDLGRLTYRRFLELTVLIQRKIIRGKEIKTAREENYKLTVTL